VKVLYVTQGWTVHDRRFVDGLVRQGHEVIYRAVATIPASRLRDLRTAGLSSVDQWGAQGMAFWLRLPRMARELRALCREVRPDVIHAGPIQRGAFVAALAGCRPLVSMSWGSDILLHARRGVGRRIAGWTLRRTDNLLCDCETVRAQCVRLGADPTRLVVFPWGVDLEDFKPGRRGEMRSMLGWETSFVLISARAWEPVYGVGLMAQAFADAVRRSASLRLLLLGDGSERGRIRHVLRQDGVGARVHVAGSVEHADLPAYFRAADLYISASHSDGSSVTLLEAMACGLPAVVSDIPSNREWIEDGSTGWTFRDGDPASLREAILHAAGAGPRLTEMGMQARRVAERRADWSKNLTRLAEAYEQARDTSARRLRGA
jgi:glycosyltransferase involved in cell wall biosynthesis